LNFVICRRQVWLLFLFAAALAGCASPAKNPQDPLEGFNRAMFSVNDKLDSVALKPAATAYKKVTPSIVQTGIGNFFANIHDIPTAFNDVLQARMSDAGSDIGRVLVNTFFGLIGTVDIASQIGLRKHDQDFGQTLARWGVQSGPYLVLPLLGPSTVRDAAATPVDLETDLWNHKYPVRWRNTGTAIRIVDHRAYVLDSTSLIEDAALDRYEFVRDAYLQHRQSEIDKPDSSKEKSGTLNDRKPDVENNSTGEEQPQPPSH
jgi:phospholipid-binding lipoprotein MlaA